MGAPKGNHEQSRLDTRTQVQPSQHLLEHPPAPAGAGEPLRQEDKRRDYTTLLEATELTVRLEIVSGMYKQLIKLGVETNKVEAEMMSVVLERVTGPTGHRLVMDVRKCDQQQDRESDLESVMEGSPVQCWRDPVLTRKLLTIRKRLVSKQLSKARSIVSGELRRAAVSGGKPGASQAWDQHREVRSKVWSQEHRRQQQKIAHLEKRAQDCNKHQCCRKVDKFWDARQANKVTGGVKSSSVTDPSIIPDTGVNTTTGSDNTVSSRQVASQVPQSEVNVDSLGTLDEQVTTSKSEPIKYDNTGSSSQVASPVNRKHVKVSVCETSNDNVTSVCQDVVKFNGIDQVEEWIESVVSTRRPVSEVKDAMVSESLDTMEDNNLFTTSTGVAHPVCDMVENEELSAESVNSETLTREFRTPELDNRLLDGEHEELVRLCNEYNKRWSSEKRERKKLIDVPDNTEDDGWMDGWILYSISVSES